MAGEDIIKALEIKQTYLTDFMTFMAYLTDKREVDEKEEKYQDTVRKMKKHG